MDRSIFGKFLKTSPFVKIQKTFNTLRRQASFRDTRGESQRPQRLYACILTVARKVGHILFNPAAANVLASASGDYTIKLWDVEAGNSKLSLEHKDIVQSLSWSADGSMLVTTCRDKKLRVWDVREGKAVVEVAGHSGAKNSRAVWMGEHDRIATTGFSKMSDRQLGLWDIRAAREPLNGFEILDQISGVCMPFWDEGTQCLYLAGKGYVMPLITLLFRRRLTN